MSANRVLSFFSASVTGSGPLQKKERGTKEESHRVQGSTERGKTRKYHPDALILYHMCPAPNTGVLMHTHTGRALMRLSSVGML